MEAGSNIDIKVNYFKPKLNNTKGVAQTKMGSPMDVVSFCDINPNESNGINKDWLPYIQIFNSGCRVAIDNVDWDTWSGIVFVDIDTKKYEGSKGIDWGTKVQMLHNNLSNLHDCYLGIQLSASGTSFHAFFYFNIIKKEANFKIAAKYAQDAVVDQFLSSDKGKEIITTDGVVDDCTQKFTQPLFISEYPLYLNRKVTGKFDVSAYQNLVQEKQITVTDIRAAESQTIKFRDAIDWMGINSWSHEVRIKLMIALGQLFKGDERQAREVYSKFANEIVGKGNTHSYEELMRLFDNQFSKLCRGNYSVSEKMLKFCKKNFGLKYTIEKQFEPQRVEAYTPDETIVLKEGERLSAHMLNIVESPHPMVHIFSGCGDGKTYSAMHLYDSLNEMDWFEWANNYSHTMMSRICFVSPMNSIIDNCFEAVPRWTIVNGNNPNKQALEESHCNICTSWDTFIKYRMYERNFDVFFFDEIHSIYMYDYRVSVITSLKSAILYLKKHKKKTILMTGTPSYETKEFDCYKIKVERETKHVPANIIFYKYQYRGWLWKNVREWIGQNPNNIAAIFMDKANQKFIDKAKVNGVEVSDKYIKSFDEDVKTLNEQHEVSGQVFVSSVYGQAGINIFTDSSKKVKIYILTTNAMGAIQYSNRFRDKECIDSINIPYLRNNINNNIKNVNANIKKQEDEARKHIDLLNQTYTQGEDRFSTDPKYRFLLRYGVQEDYAAVDYVGKIDFLKHEFMTMTLIKNVCRYETQIQVLYNRLMDAQYDVSYIYLDKDIADKSDTSKFGFTEHLMALDYDNVVMQMNDGEDLWLNVENNKPLKRQLVGTSRKDIATIMTYFWRESNHNMDYVKSSMEGFVKQMVAKHKAVLKTDLSDFVQVIETKKNFNKYADQAFITLLLDEKNKVEHVAAYYVALTYVNGVDIQKAAEEALTLMKQLRRWRANFDWFFDWTTSSWNCQLENSGNYSKEVRAKAYHHLKSKNQQGGHNKKRVKIDGVIYESETDAENKLGKSYMTIHRWLKNGKAKFVD